VAIAKAVNCGDVILKVETVRDISAPPFRRHRLAAHRFGAGTYRRRRFGAGRFGAALKGDT